jgi:excisionase family DNA binding protein
MSEKMIERLLLSPREAAKALSICEKTLWTITQGGKIPVVRIGRAVRYPVDGLQEWIRRQSQESTCQNVE